MSHDEASILKRTTATGVSAATRRLGYFAARGGYRMSCHHPPHSYFSKCEARTVSLQGDIRGGVFMTRSTLAGRKRGLVLRG
jgi:hypothetical protein